MQLTAQLFPSLRSLSIGTARTCMATMAAARGGQSHLVVSPVVLPLRCIGARQGHGSSVVDGWPKCTQGCGVNKKIMKMPRWAWV